ncbi:MULTISPECIES: OmpW/AlkL family protein [Dyella]|uniref:OmpW family protein n=2 Tax=Dyella TaxID=231454 RepID=A0A4R0YJH9_9GAMM|nr:MULTISPECIES: OmpW family outer membrane protein [Dyella]TBR35830.1 OmpW family protein [Dyella terrae]TCI08622.1 OmpW family protein [Dyella soli]
MKLWLPLIAIAGLGLNALPAHAADDSWIVRFGAHVVDPKSDNGHLAGMKASVGSDLKPTASLEYKFTPNWGMDLLVAAPFSHSIRLNGTNVATTKQLPPVLGVNYHFMPDSDISPFIGVGVNYTRFFNTDSTGPLEGTKVRIDSSWGAAAHAGVDFRLNKQWIVTADVRWIDLASDVHVNGVKVGRATINPLAYGLSFGYTF